MAEFMEIGLPLRRVALFSSGVAFFERRGSASGSVKIVLPFPVDDVDDVLKSLTIVDEASAMPSVTYPAEDTLAATLGSLKPDLTDNPGLASLLNAVRGTEIAVVTASGTMAGQVLGVEERWNAENERTESCLSLYSEGTVQVVWASAIRAYRFDDDAISTDLERALESLLSAATSKLRNLEVRLPAARAREVMLAYVSSAPVWKAAYRLDVTSFPASMQAWAIIDNSSDTDWTDVELSLFVGRPSSFTQPLYRPHHVRRAEVPLLIAGSADARVYELDYALDYPMDQVQGAGGVPVPAAAMAFDASKRSVGQRVMLESAASAVSASAKAAGEQFAFTFPNRVTLNRHQSAMLPLTQGNMTARKVSIFRGQEIGPEQEANPALGIQLTNSTGVSLPAGPVTVFDDGLYAGDALLEFLPDGTNRLLSYGDDLAVRGSCSSKATDWVVTARMAKGVLTIGVATTVRTEYKFNNAATKSRTLLLEHPRRGEERLAEPEHADEVTASLYRFELPLPPGPARFAVETSTLEYEEVRLVEQSQQLLAMFSRRGLPPNTRAMIEHVAELRGRQENADRRLAALETAEQKLVADVVRVRENLSAVGADSRSGGNYQQRLDDLENTLTMLRSQQDALRRESEAVTTELADYIARQDFEDV